MKRQRGPATLAMRAFQVIAQPLVASSSFAEPFVDSSVGLTQWAHGLTDVLSVAFLTEAPTDLLFARTKCRSDRASSNAAREVSLTTRPSPSQLDSYAHLLLPSRSLYLVSDPFHSLFKVLFIFRSLYLFAIGL